MIIFLDIDGVLNNLNSAKAGNWVSALDHTNWDKNALELLQLIVDCTRADIVISSTWRKTKSDPTWWNEQFELAGLQAECVGVTGCSHNGFRGREIWAYVFENEIEDYVILDDDRDFYPNQPFVHVNMDVGLTLADAELAIAFLRDGEPLPEFEVIQEVQR